MFEGPIYFLVLNITFKQLLFIKNQKTHFSGFKILVKIIENVIEKKQQKQQKLKQRRKQKQTNKNKQTNKQTNKQSTNTLKQAQS